jgi:hypothetical protein
MVDNWCRGAVGAFGEVTAVTTNQQRGRKFGCRQNRRKGLQAACVPALQEHQPPPGVRTSPLEEEVDNWCRLLGTSSLKEGAM